MNTKTIKTLFPFLILLAFLAYNLEAEIENSFPNGAMVRDASNHADNALGNLGAYSKAEVDAIVATPTAEIAAHATSNNTHGCTNIASEAAIAAHAALSTTHNATTLASEAYVTGYAAKLAGDAAQDFMARDFNGYGNASFASSITASGGVDLPRNARICWAVGDTFVSDGVTTAQNGLTYGPDMGNKVSLFGYYGLKFGDHGLTRFTIDDGNASFSGDVRATSFTLGGNLKTGSNWISGDGDNEGVQVNTAGEVLIATSTDAGDYKLQVNGNTYVSGTISQRSGSGTMVIGYSGDQGGTTSLVNDRLYKISAPSNCFSNMLQICLSSGQGSTVVYSYASSGITILNVASQIAATASPTAQQIGIYKAENSNELFIKAGSDASTAASVMFINFIGGKPSVSYTD